MPSVSLTRTLSASRKLPMGSLFVEGRVSLSTSSRSVACGLSLGSVLGVFGVVVALGVRDDDIVAIADTPAQVVPHQRCLAGVLRRDDQRVQPGLVPGQVKGLTGQELLAPLPAVLPVCLIAPG